MLGAAAAVYLVQCQQRALRSLY
eukprot:COSAG06_NODE_63374_length_262_cov_0.950920_1_plen_22_part_01